MRPKRLQLTDWCQHESFELVFAEGMNAIQGANGSGKTNLLEALNLCLSQDTNGSGKKSDNIRNGSDKARLCLVFEHENVEGTVNVTLKRNYKVSSEELAASIEMATQAVEANARDSSAPVSAEQLHLASFKPRETTAISLKWADIECRNATEVAEFMRSRVLLDPKIIKTNFFPRQGDVDGAMSSDKEVRTKVFHEKAGTALCGRIWDELGKSSRGAPTFEHTESSLDEAKGRLALAQGELKEATEVWEKAKALMTDVEADKEVVRRYMSTKEAQTDLATQQEQLNALAVSVAELAETCSGITARGKDLRVTYDGLVPSMDAWKKELWEAKDMLSKVETRAKYVQQEEEFRKKLEALVEPAPLDFTKETVEEAVKRATEIAVQAKQLDEWLEVFSEGKCPTCGQAIDQETVNRYGFDRAGMDVEGARTKATTLSEALTSYERALAAYNQSKASTESAHKQVLAHLESMPEVVVPSQERINELNDSINNVLRMESELESLRKEHALAYDKWTKAKTSHDTLEASIQGLLREASGGGCPTEEEFKKAGERVQEAQFNMQTQREAQVAYEVSSKRVADLQADVERLVAEVAKMKPVKHWLSLLSQARELLHKEALPSEVVAWYAQQLAEHTQKYLDMFDAGFQLAVSKDLDLVGVFPDKIMPASRFSGGEKNITNISMRLAMVDLFPSDLRLLVLDEVEVHLDQNKVSKLPAILEKVKGLARNRGLVVLFVSHHPMLGDVSDHVIRTSAA